MVGPRAAPRGDAPDHLSRRRPPGDRVGPGRQRARADLGPAGPHTAVGGCGRHRRRGSSIHAPPRGGRSRGGPGRPDQRARSLRPRRQHHHAAAGARSLLEPRADLVAEGARDRHRRAARAPLLQAGNPGIVSQHRVSGARAGRGGPRRRDRSAPSLRQEARGAPTRRGGTAGVSDPGAEPDLRGVAGADPQPPRPGSRGDGPRGHGERGRCATGYGAPGAAGADDRLHCAMVPAAGPGRGGAPRRRRPDRRRTHSHEPRSAPPGGGRDGGARPSGSGRARSPRSRSEPGSSRRPPSSPTSLSSFPRSAAPGRRTTSTDASTDR